VGRAIVHSYLRQRRLTSHVTVPISAGLLADTAGYVRALTAYRSGDPLPIVGEFARAALDAAAVGRELLAELRDIRGTWEERLAARRDSVAWRIADQLVGHPAVTAELAATRNGVSAAATRNAIAALVDAGILVKASVGRRNQVWVAEEITSCYDRLAVLMGRRQAW
jgi:Fic family protein